MAMNDKYVYPALLTVGRNEKVKIYIPDFNIRTMGFGEAGAMIEGQELLTETIQKMQAEGKEIPEPSTISMKRKNADKVLIYIQALIPDQE